jgi:hypothetical protein
LDKGIHSGFKDRGRHKGFHIHGDEKVAQTLMSFALVVQGDNVLVKCRAGEHAAQCIDDQR